DQRSCSALGQPYECASPENEQCRDKPDAAVDQRMPPIGLRWGLGRCTHGGPDPNPRNMGCKGLGFEADFDAAGSTCIDEDCVTIVVSSNVPFPHQARDHGIVVGSL